MFQTNLGNKFTFIQILVTFWKVKGILEVQLEQTSRMESFATIVNGF